jgi:hypothetical protein
MWDLVLGVQNPKYAVVCIGARWVTKNTQPLSVALCIENSSKLKHQDSVAKHPREVQWPLRSAPTHTFHPVQGLHI